MGSGLLTWSENTCEVCGLEEPKTNLVRHVLPAHRLECAATLHNYLALIITTSGRRGPQAIPVSMQVSDIQTSRRARTMSGVLGILSHERVAKLEHLSVALETVQGRRHSKSVPGGLSLHRYANLYFDARNPMMYYLKDRTDLVVVRVSPDVLDIPDTVVSDGNAAAEGTRFYPSPEGLCHLDSGRVFAQYWIDPDYWLMKEKKACSMC